MMASNISRYALINIILKSRFAINKKNLVYQKIDNK